MKTFASLVVVFIALASGRTPSQSLRDETPLRWGQAVEGLRIGLAGGMSVSPSAAEFNIALQNVGPSDFVINLGEMLANGRVMFPSAVRLTLTDTAGNRRDLKFFDRRNPGVAGRVDDFTVALRLGATYTFPVSLDQYWSEATREFGIRLTPGRYRIAASFDGTGAKTMNLDMPGVALLNFWKGTVRSSDVEFDVAP